MSTFSKPALLDGTKAVALSLALGVVLAFVPVLSLLAVPLLPIPVAYVTYRYGVGLGTLASLVTGAIGLVLTGVAVGLLIVMLVALAGIGAGLCLKLGFSQFRLFVSVAAIFFVSLFMWTGSLLMLAGVGPVDAMQKVSDRAVEPSRELYQAMGMNQQDIDSYIAEVREFATALPYLAPALLLVLSVGFSGATLALARRVFERLRQPFPRDFTFRNLRLHFAFAYMMIAGLICEFSAPYLPEAYGSAMSLAGVNLLIVSEVVFFIQGMAIANYFLWHYKVTKLKKTGGYLCLVLLQITLSLTSWIGLFDTWIDYRRRLARKKPA